MYISKFFLTFFLCLSKKRFYIPIVNLCNVLKLQICPLVGHTYPNCVRVCVWGKPSPLQVSSLTKRHIPKRTDSAGTESVATKDMFRNQSTGALMRLYFSGSPDPG